MPSDVLFGGSSNAADVAANGVSGAGTPTELDIALRPPAADSPSPTAKTKTARSSVPEFARASGTSPAGGLANAGIPGAGGSVVPAVGEETESQVSSRIRQLLASQKQGPVFTERASARGAGLRSDVVSTTIPKSDDAGGIVHTDELSGEPAEPKSLAELVKHPAADEQATQLDQLLAQLRIGQVHAEKEVAAKGEGEAEPNDLAEVPAPPSSTQPSAPQRPATKLWVPGQGM